MESKELTIGRAGEHLVMFDLLSKGYKCFMTDQGNNYDIVLEYKNKLIRLQVKTTQKPMLMNKEYKTKSYLFHVRRAGRGGKRYYSVKEFEGFALATLDTKSVYYYNFNNSIKRTLIFRDRRFNYRVNAGKIAPYLDEFTLERFLNEL